jgi:hypothetical protein
LIDRQRDAAAANVPQQLPGVLDHGGATPASRRRQGMGHLLPQRRSRRQVAETYTQNATTGTYRPD